MAYDYNGMLSQSQGIYSQVLSGYQGVLAQQRAAEAQVAQGYSSLSQNVLGTIRHVGKSQKQAIQDAYAQQTGQAQQSLINAGLGNTTVTSSVGRGLMFDRQKAEVALANQLAQLKAGYMSQIGLAGLGYRGQAIQADSGVGMAQLGYQGDYSKALLGLAGQIRPHGGYSGYGGGGGTNFGGGGSRLPGPIQYGNESDNPNMGLAAMGANAYASTAYRPMYTDPYIQTPAPAMYGSGQSDVTAGYSGAGGGGSWGNPYGGGGGIYADQMSGGMYGES